MPRLTIEAGQRLHDSGFLEQLPPDPTIFNMPITPPLASQPITTLASSPATLPVAEAAKPRLSAAQKQLLCSQERLMQSALVHAPSAAPSDTARSAEVDKLATAADDEDKIEVAAVIKPVKTKGKGKHKASRNLNL